MPSEPTHDPTPNLECSYTTCCVALGNNLSEESTNQTETAAAGDVTNMTRTEKQQRKQANTVFNKVRQFAYVLGTTRGREIKGERDFIDSKINYDLFLLQGISPFNGIQYMRALSLIYRHRVPGI